MTAAVARRDGEHRFEVFCLVMRSQDPCHAHSAWLVVAANFVWHSIPCLRFLKCVGSLYVTLSARVNALNKSLQSCAQLLTITDDIRVFILYFGIERWWSRSD